MWRPSQGCHAWASGWATVPGRGVACSQGMFVCLLPPSLCGMCLAGPQVTGTGSLCRVSSEDCGPGSCRGPA